MRLFILLPLLSACSEYDVSGAKNNEGVLDSESQDTAGESLPIEVDACEATSAGAIDVVVNTECDVPVSQGTFTPVKEWTIRGHMGYGPAVAAQLDDDNGDGIVDNQDNSEIIYMANTGEGVVCLDGKTGAVEWINRDATDIASAVAVGDIDADGDMEIVASNGPAQLVLMDHTGRTLWRAQINNADLMTFLYPSIADMDADGYPEIIAGRNIVDGNGQVVGTGNLGVGSVMNQNYAYNEGSASVAVDLNGDGKLEVVVGNAAYRKNGTALYSNGGNDGMPAVADFDLDGSPEIVVVQGNRVWTLESDMTPTGWQDSFPNTNYIGPPAIDDLDGDGVPEFVVVGSNEMRAYHWNGSRLWTAPVTDSSGAAGPILFDFELDGYPEVVYADETTVRVFNGLDGSVKLSSNDHSSYTGFETPMVADVDADGEVEIVMLHGNGPNGITVYGDQNHSWPPGRSVWNQHAYTITNVNDDGSIPTNQPANWLTYNNYRSGDAGLPPSSWNDLVPEVVDVCTKECPDTLILVARVWNAGTEEVPAGLSVGIRAGANGTVVATATVPDPIPSGRSSQGVQLTVAVADLQGKKPFLVVDTDASGYSSVTECLEDNNAIVVTEVCE